MDTYEVDIIQCRISCETGTVDKIASQECADLHRRNRDQPRRFIAATAHRVEAERSVSGREELAVAALKDFQGSVSVSSTESRRGASAAEHAGRTGLRLSLAIAGDRKIVRRVALCRERDGFDLNRRTANSAMRTIRAGEIAEPRCGKPPT